MQSAAKDQQAAALQDYYILKAPFDGVITKKHFEPGQLAIPGQPIVSIDALGGFKVQLGIPENLAGGLTPGDSLEVLVEDGVGIARELTGSLIVLGAAADPASHLVSAELSLADVEGLRSGQFVRVRVPSGEREVLLVPVTAIERDGELNYVWRVSAAGSATRANVETGERQGELLEVLRGLSAGDIVLTELPPGLYSGVKIAGAGGTAQEAATAVGGVQ
jgi:RND family efflux transporter MFP subunit